MGTRRGVDPKGTLVTTNATEGPQNPLPPPDFAPPDGSGLPADRVRPSRRIWPPRRPRSPLPTDRISRRPRSPLRGPTCRLTLASVLRPRSRSPSPSAGRPPAPALPPPAADGHPTRPARPHPPRWPYFRYRLRPPRKRSRGADF